MASVKFEKSSSEWLMFRDYWNLCQEYWEPDMDDRYWEELIHKADEFCTKYRNIPLSKKIMIGLLEVLEEKENENVRQRNMKGIPLIK